MFECVCVCVCVCGWVGGITDRHRERVMKASLKGKVGEAEEEEARRRQMKTRDEGSQEER